MKRGRVKAVGSKDNGLRLINRKNVSGLYQSSSDDTLHRDSGSTGTSDVLYSKMALSLDSLLFTELPHFHSCLSLWTLLWTMTGWDRAVFKPAAIAPTPPQELWGILKLPRAWVINEGSAIPSGRWNRLNWAGWEGRRWEGGGHGALRWTLLVDVLTWDLLFPLFHHKKGSCLRSGACSALITSEISSFLSENQN